MTRHFLNGSIHCNCTKCAQEEEKEKKVDDIAQETDEDKEKKKELESLKAELRGKSHEELDKIKEDLQAEIDELTDKKKKDSRKASANYSVIGYDNSGFRYNASEGDDLLTRLGSS